MPENKHASAAELAEATWRKGSDGDAGDGSVEVAFLSNGNIGLRDSSNPTGPALIFTPSEWDAFLAGARDGEFNQQ